MEGWVCRCCRNDGKKNNRTVLFESLDDALLHAEERLRLQGIQDGGEDYLVCLHQIIIKLRYVNT